MSSLLIKKFVSLLVNIFVLLILKIKTKTKTKKKTVQHEKLSSQGDQSKSHQSGEGKLKKKKLFQKTTFKARMKTKIIKKKKKTKVVTNYNQIKIIFVRKRNLKKIL